MIRYYIVAALVLAAILCADACVPVTVICTASALVLSYGKTSYTN